MATTPNKTRNMLSDVVITSKTQSGPTQQSTYESGKRTTTTSFSNAKYGPNVGKVVPNIQREQSRPFISQDKTKPYYGKMVIVDNQGQVKEVQTNVNIKGVQAAKPATEGVNIKTGQPVSYVDVKTGLPKPEPLSVTRTKEEAIKRADTGSVSYVDVKTGLPKEAPVIKPSVVSPSSIKQAQGYSPSGQPVSYVTPSGTPTPPRQSVTNFRNKSFGQKYSELTSGQMIKSVSAAEDLQSSQIKTGELSSGQKAAIRASSAILSPFSPGLSVAVAAAENKVVRGFYRGAAEEIKRPETQKELAIAGGLALTDVIIAGPTGEGIIPAIAITGSRAGKIVAGGVRIAKGVALSGPVARTTYEGMVGAQESLTSEEIQKYKKENKEQLRADTLKYSQLRTEYYGPSETRKNPLTDTPLPKIIGGQTLRQVGSNALLFSAVFNPKKEIETKLKESLIKEGVTEKQAEIRVKAASLQYQIEKVAEVPAIVSTEIMANRIGKGVFNILGSRGGTVFQTIAKGTNKLTGAERLARTGAIWSLPISAVESKGQLDVYEKQLSNPKLSGFNKAIAYASGAGTSAGTNYFIFKGIAARKPVMATSAYVIGTGSDFPGEILGDVADLGITAVTKRIPRPGTRLFHSFSPAIIRETKPGSDVAIISTRETKGININNPLQGIISSIQDTVQNKKGRVKSTNKMTFEDLIKDKQTEDAQRKKPGTPPTTPERTQPEEEIPVPIKPEDKITTNTRNIFNQYIEVNEPTKESQNQQFQQTINVPAQQNVPVPIPIMNAVNPSAFIPFLPPGMLPESRGAGTGGTTQRKRYINELYAAGLGGFGQRRPVKMTKKEMKKLKKLQKSRTKNVTNIFGTKILSSREYSKTFRSLL